LSLNLDSLIRRNNNCVPLGNWFSNSNWLKRKHSQTSRTVS